jgi:DNA-directed RNA polymerase subunit F
VATFYNTKSQELVEFIIDVLIYKGILKDRNVSIEELKNFIERIQSGQKDEFDNLILDVFNKVIEYQQKFLEYDRKSGDLRKNNW